MSWRTYAAALALLAAGCSVPNESHCGNQSGDASCAARDPERPFCNLCEASNDGCVAERVTVDACHRESDSGAAQTTTDAQTSTTTTTTTGTPTTTVATTVDSTTTTSNTTVATTSTSADTTSTSTSTSTSTTDDTTATTTTTGTTTETTTETSTDTQAETLDTTTMPGPVCGNNIAEAGETCDGTDLKGKECSDFPSLYGGGDLLCAANCKSYDFTACCKLPGIQCSAASECCSDKCNFGLPSKCG